MSHNKIKVAGQSPDSNGDITVNVEHLDDVNLTSLANEQTLQYDSASSKWVNINTSAIGEGTALLIGDGSSQNYPTGGSALAVGVDLHFYNLVYNGISATVGSGWVDSVTLPAGSYLCNAISAITFSASTGSAVYRWHDGTSAIGTSGTVGFDTDTIGSSCSAYVSSTSSITLSVRLTSVSSVNALSSQGTRAAEYGYIEIRKLN